MIDGYNEAPLCSSFTSGSFNIDVIFHVHCTKPVWCMTVSAAKSCPGCAVENAVLYAGLSLHNPWRSSHQGKFSRTLPKRTMNHTYDKGRDYLPISHLVFGFTFSSSIVRPAPVEPSSLLHSLYFLQSLKRLISHDLDNYWVHHNVTNRLMIESSSWLDWQTWMGPDHTAVECLGHGHFWRLHLWFAGSSVPYVHSFVDNDNLD